MGSQHFNVPRQAVRTRIPYKNGAEFITTTMWQVWEIRRVLDAGKFGYFNSDGVAE